MPSVVFRLVANFAEGDEDARMARVDNLSGFCEVLGNGGSKRGQGRNPMDVPEGGEVGWVVRTSLRR